jgi:hypothetical protein
MKIMWEILQFVSVIAFVSSLVAMAIYFYPNGKELSLPRKERSTCMRAYSMGMVMSLLKPIDPVLTSGILNLDKLWRYKMKKTSVNYRTYFSWEAKKARNNRILGFVVGVILTSAVWYILGGIV